MLFLAALDTAATAKSLEERPWPFFLALTLGALSFIFTVYLASSRASARRERDLFKQLHQQERDRAQELKHERDRAREDTDKVRAEHIRDLVKLTVAAEELVRMRLDLERKKKKPPESG